MSFIIFVAVMWFIVSLVRNAAAQQQKKSQVVLPPDWFGTHDALPESHVRRVGVAAPAVRVPAVPGGEASTSELMLDETAADHDLNLDHAEVVSLEGPGMSVAPRPLPAAAVSRETEVNWEQEHERFHKRYVDARPQGHTAVHGLVDELRDPAGARRAVLLAEILGPPVSLRR